MKGGCSSVEEHLLHMGEAPGSISILVNLSFYSYGAYVPVYHTSEVDKGSEGGIGSPGS